MQRSCAIRSVALLLTILMLLGLLPMTALAANDGATAQSGDIFDELRGKFYSMAVGGTYDPTDPALKEILTSINDTAQDYWNRMNKNPVSNAVKAKEAMQWAVAKGLISGKSGARLDPSGSATRAEAATVLVRFLRQS